MRVIIRCAGGARRWADYLGVPKHLAPINGEPVLHRTVRLCNEIAPDADVKVIVQDLSDKRYKVPGSSRSTDKPTPEYGDVDKIASSRHLWDRERTVTMWGDIWWTRQAITDVLTADHNDWHAWLRFGPDGEGGELFAFSWPSEAHDQVFDAIARVVAAQQAGKLTGTAKGGLNVPGGWALYRSLAGVDLLDHGDHGNCTIVDDWTEDFDTAHDWDEWCYRWATTPPDRRPS